MKNKCEISPSLKFYSTPSYQSAIKTEAIDSTRKKPESVTSICHSLRKIKKQTNAHRVKRCCFNEIRAKARAILLIKSVGIDDCTPSGCTALVVSCSRGLPDTVKLLLDVASVSTEDTHGATALIVSSQRGYFQMTRLLLTAGAGLENKDIFRNTPLHLATKSGHSEVMGVSERGESGQSPKRWEDAVAPRSQTWKTATYCDAS